MRKIQIMWAIAASLAPQMIFAQAQFDAASIRESGAGPNEGGGLVRVDVTSTRATTMSEFTERLSDFATVDRPVLDKTGLTGRFDFRLVSAARGMRGGEGPFIFTAVSELGLQVKPATEPVGMVVIDRAEKKPTEN